MRTKLLASIICLTVLIQTTAFQVSAKDNSLYEAENAAMTGNIKSCDDADASGGKSAGIFDNDADSLTFEIEVTDEGSYDLIITSKGMGGSKSNNIFVDGSQAGSFESEGDVYTDSILRGVLLTAGTHEISITKSWGWTYVDCLKVVSSDPIPDSVYNVNDMLINSKASSETKSLFSYLCKIYGNWILSGQFTDNGINSDEFRAIYDATGKYPAVLGLDLMNYCPSRQEKGAECYAVERAIEFHDKGGIITMSWHWNSPDEYLKDGNEENGSPRWWGGFYTSNTNIDIEAIMNGEDSKGKELLDADIAAIAKQLSRLQDAGVPVLWRPLHEASGGWFWWGAKGSEAYKKFWYYLYDQFTNTYNLNNLIWVWNGSAADWYPGDEYVDIIGDDIYIDSYSPSTARFLEIIEYTKSNKMIAMTENGDFFDIDQAMATNTKWAWFNTWGNGFTQEDANSTDENVRINVLRKIYLNEHTVTLDELPDFNTYLKDKIKGDVNSDGQFNISDVVLMQKWLVEIPDIKLSDWKAGDLCEDKKLNVFDLCLMKRLLTNS